LTADVFAGATDSFNTDLKRNSDEATRTIASHFSGDSAASLWVQAFVALSESLPAFVVNAWYTLLRSDSPVVNIDELLRYAAPSRMELRRSAAGETIMLNLASANRDLRCSRTRTFTIRLRVFLSGSRGRIITYE
jgi:hypothetical protein